MPEKMTNTSHLVMLFVVSAGKNGEDLGSDEEQIVFLVYLIYDVTNDKVSVYVVVHVHKCTAMSTVPCLIAEREKRL